MTWSTQMTLKSSKKTTMNRDPTIQNQIETRFSESDDAAKLKLKKYRIQIFEAIYFFFFAVFFKRLM